MATPPAQAGSDRAQLAAIVDEFRQLLGTALDEHEEWFAEGMPVHLREAWPSVRSRIANAIGYLIEPPDPDLLDAGLADVGLTEPESKPKKEGWGGAFRRWVRAPSKPVLRSALGWMNIILGSLSGVVPGIEAVKEYKESCEQALEDGDIEAEDGFEPEDGSEPPAPRPFKPPPEFDI